MNDLIDYCFCGRIVAVGLVAELLCCWKLVLLAGLCFNSKKLFIVDCPALFTFGEGLLKLFSFRWSIDGVDVMLVFGNCFLNIICQATYYLVKQHKNLVVFLMYIQAGNIRLILEYWVFSKIKDT